MKQNYLCAAIVLFSSYRADDESDENPLRQATCHRRDPVCFLSNAGERMFANINGGLLYLPGCKIWAC